jgi:hypothetical protein
MRWRKVCRFACLFSCRHGSRPPITAPDDTSRWKSVKAIYILIRSEVADEEQLIEDLGNLLDRYRLCPGVGGGCLIAVANLKDDGDRPPPRTVA